MSTYVGLDIGGTASRWVVADDVGGVVARGAADGAGGHVFNPRERERLRGALSAVAEATRAFSPLAAVLGISGLGAGSHDAVRGILVELFGLPPAHIALGDDIELAFRAAFAPGEGHLVSAGTGSIGVHLRTNGESVRVGGRGMLIDDGGSGTWIALRALDRLYRRIDETGDAADASVLASELFAQIGGDRWDDVRSFVYGSDRGRIGALAQAVARAASKGDPLALDILQQAATELARLARALMVRVGPLPVAFVGGVVDLHPLIKPALVEALPESTVTFPQIDAAAQAAQRARSLFPIA